MTELVATTASRFPREEIHMAHLLDNMAYVGETPWHSLGNKLTGMETLDQWRVAAGLDWSVQESPVQFQAGEDLLSSDSHKVLFRSDRKTVLGVVSDRYNTVQPAQILDFYRDFAATNNFQLETAGSLAGGKKIWALAKVADGFSIKGNDTIMPYVLLATSYDKTMATRAMFTTVRVVCNNTLQLSVNNDTSGISIPHSAVFDGKRVAVDLGLMTVDFADMQDKIILLSDVRVARKTAQQIIANVLFDVKAEEMEDMSTKSKNIVTGVTDLFDGRGIGSDLAAANGTAWGLVNAITQYTDHSAGRNANTRMNSAWFGQGANMKQRIWDQAMALAA